MKKVTGVTFGGTWVWQIMRDLGFTPQKPELRAKERKKTAIAAWKKKTLPDLKKMGTKTRVLPGI